MSLIIIIGNMDEDGRLSEGNSCVVVGLLDGLALIILVMIRRSWSPCISLQRNVKDH